jgi:hypothetical protein
MCLILEHEWVRITISIPIRRFTENRAIPKVHGALGMFATYFYNIQITERYIYIPRMVINKRHKFKIADPAD